MLAPGSYAEICSRFSWQVPAQFNIGVAVCDRWATNENKPSLIYEDPAGNVQTFSFDDLKLLTDRLANVFVAHGIKRGDRVGILLPQRPETALSHIVAASMAQHARGYNQDAILESESVSSCFNFNRLDKALGLFVIQDVINNLHEIVSTFLCRHNGVFFLRPAVFAAAKFRKRLVKGRAKFIETCQI
jgi:AMP-binding enzyme